MIIGFIIWLVLIVLGLMFLAGANKGGGCCGGSCNQGRSKCEDNCEDK